MGAPLPSPSQRAPRPVASQLAGRSPRVRDRGRELPGEESQRVDRVLHSSRKVTKSLLFSLTSYLVLLSLVQSSSSLPQSSSSLFSSFLDLIRLSCVFSVFHSSLRSSLIRFVVFGLVSSCLVVFGLVPAPPRLARVPPGPPEASRGPFATGT